MEDEIIGLNIVLEVEVDSAKVSGKFLDSLDNREFKTLSGLIWR